MKSYVKQKRDWDCGPVALANVRAHFFPGKASDRYVSDILVDSYVKLCETDQEGTSNANMVKGLVETFGSKLEIVVDYNLEPWELDLFLDDGWSVIVGHEMKKFSHFTLITGWAEGRWGYAVANAHRCKNALQGFWPRTVHGWLKPKTEAVICIALRPKKR